MKSKLLFLVKSIWIGIKQTAILIDSDKGMTAFYIFLAVVLGLITTSSIAGLLIAFALIGLPYGITAHIRANRKIREMKDR